MKGTVIAITVVFYVLTGLLCTAVWYGLSADTDAWTNRAQVAADREDMREYLVTLKGNMERRGLTDGHFALVFRKADNDLALHYRAVTRAIERLDAIADIPKDATAYQVALDDIRGTVRELPDFAAELTWCRLWWAIIPMCVFWLWPLWESMKYP